MRTWALAGVGLAAGLLIVEVFRPRRAGSKSAQAPTAADFQTAIERLIRDARRRGDEHVDLNAGDLHSQVGGYPGPAHHLAQCCAVMREAMGPDDFAIKEPRSGSGATLTLRYHLA